MKPFVQDVKVVKRWPSNKMKPTILRSIVNEAKCPIKFRKYKGVTQPKPIAAIGWLQLSFKI